ncbi:FKBP-type 16 kDa peptidyl-prolyl cis-trans isomerase [archaeon BMS3Abin17]|nr:FKBP-type 16 kDa peptidyl-prolyl cis-trans isomerase [archaeon BMS3Abin17]HDZ60090.1 peptidylprolyl isomerase [Candidatus Pacearchaeota archaeon]
MELKKKDFIQVEFTGKLKDGSVFDSNIKKDLEKADLDIKAKPFTFCLGEGMFIKGVDDFLVGKDVGSYKIELNPEDAFGKRDSKLVQMMPMKVFIEQKINPVQGAVFNFDGRIAKVLTVSGGRIMVDFNNPMAGKEVVYNLKVLKKIEDINEKIKALNEFLFKKDFKFEVKDKKITLHVEKPMLQFVELFKDKFKDIFGLELGVKEIEEKSDKKEAEKKTEEKEEKSEGKVEEKKDKSSD